MNDPRNGEEIRIRMEFTRGGGRKTMSRCVMAGPEVLTS